MILLPSCFTVGMVFLRSNEVCVFFCHTFFFEFTPNKLILVSSPQRIFSHVVGWSSMCLLVYSSLVTWCCFFRKGFFLVTLPNRLDFCNVRDIADSWTVTPAVSATDCNSFNVIGGLVVASLIMEKGWCNALQYFERKSDEVCQAVENGAPLCQNNARMVQGSQNKWPGVAQPKSTPQSNQEHVAEVKNYSA